MEEGTVCTVPDHADYLLVSSLNINLGDVPCLRSFIRIALRIPAVHSVRIISMRSRAHAHGQHIQNGGLF